jgi:hypothetical protein
LLRSGVGSVQSLTVREPKVGEEEVVESPPKVSDLALVRSFVGSEQGNFSEVSPPTAVSSKYAPASAPPNRSGAGAR